MKFFLSHSGKIVKKTFCKFLYDTLTSLGHKVFLDIMEIPLADKNIDLIFKNIKESDYFICVLTCDFYDSEWCIKEFTHAEECKIKIIPIFLDHPTNMCPNRKIKEYSGMVKEFYVNIDRFQLYVATKLNTIAIDKIQEDYQSIINSGRFSIHIKQLNKEWTYLIINDDIILNENRFKNSFNFILEIINTGSMVEQPLNKKISLYYKNVEDPFLRKCLAYNTTITLKGPKTVTYTLTDENPTFWSKVHNLWRILTYPHLDESKIIYKSIIENSDTIPAERLQSIIKISKLKNSIDNDVEFDEIGDPINIRELVKLGLFLLPFQNLSVIRKVDPLKTPEYPRLMRMSSRDSITIFDQ